MHLTCISVVYLILKCYSGHFHSLLSLMNFIAFNSNTGDLGSELLHIDNEFYNCILNINACLMSIKSPRTVPPSAFVASWESDNKCTNNGICSVLFYFNVIYPYVSSQSWSVKFHAIFRKEINMNLIRWLLVICWLFNCFNISPIYFWQVALTCCT